MANLYAALIINKKRLFDTVPAELQNLVKDKLNELGYDTNGNPLSADQ